MKKRNLLLLLITLAALMVLSSLSFAGSGAGTTFIPPATKFRSDAYQDNPSGPAPNSGASPQSPDSIRSKPNYSAGTTPSTSATLGRSDYGWDSLSESERQYLGRMQNRNWDKMPLSKRQEIMGNVQRRWNRMDDQERYQKLQGYGSQTRGKSSPYWDGGTTVRDTYKRRDER